MISAACNEVGDPKVHVFLGSNIFIVEVAYVAVHGEGVQELGILQGLGKLVVGDAVHVLVSLMAQGHSVQEELQVPVFGGRLAAGGQLVLQPPPRLHLSHVRVKLVCFNTICQRQLPLALATAAVSHVIHMCMLITRLFTH